MKIGAVIVATVASLFLVATFWGGALLGRPSDSREEITVFAAASLTSALEELAREYEDAHGVRVRMDFSSSGLLRTKIETGARGDLFLSASAGYTDQLEKGGYLLPKTRRNFLRNGLVCVVRNDSVSLTSTPADLLGDGIRRIAIGDPAHVPAGRHARQALESLRCWSALRRKLVPCADVRAALAQAEAGTVEAAIVYRSDAEISNMMKVAFSFPSESHQPIIYPGVMLKDGPNPEAGKAFLDFITSTRGAEVFVRYGFRPVGEEG